MKRTYSEMKDSGVEWIGEIPKEWKIIKIKNIAFLKGRIGWQGLESKEYQEEGAFLITGTDFEDGTINWDNCVHISEQRYYEDKLLHIKENDLLITKDGTIGKIAIVKNCPEQATLNSGVMYIRGNSAYRYLTKYLYYVLMSEEFWEWYNASQRGNSTIKHLYQEQFYNFIFAFPSLSEQTTIANYLDEKCAEIDSIISEAKNCIEEYKQWKSAIIFEAVTKGLDPNAEMKDSDVEWIGEIPKKWQTNKFKRFLYRNETKNKGDKEVLSLYRELGIVPKNSRADNHNVTSEDTSKYKYVRIGDFVVNKMQAWQGSVAISDYEGIVSPAYYVYSFKNNTYKKRYFHFLLRSCYKDEFRRLSGGIRIGQWDLPAEALEDIFVIVPPLSEQTAISDYLDKKCAGIDEVTSEKESLISELELYKKSLIYEVVTGKIKVS